MTERLVFEVDIETIVSPVTGRAQPVGVRVNGRTMSLRSWLRRLEQLGARWITPQVLAAEHQQAAERDGRLVQPAKGMLREANA
jgi:hypothetical protein